MSKTLIIVHCNDAAPGAAVRTRRAGEVLRGGFHADGVPVSTPLWWESARAEEGTTKAELMMAALRRAGIAAEVDDVRAQVARITARARYSHVCAAVRSVPIGSYTITVEAP